MKLKSLLLACGLGLLSTAYAENHHVHPKAEGLKSEAVNSAKKAMTPGYCEIEIINNSYDNVTVYGRFDDGSSLTPFNVYSFEAPHYIDLHYYGYCHRDMYLDIVTFNGYHIYSGYTRSETTVRIVPYLKNQVKAEIKAK
ncbi:Uncharacterised protein [Legionella beliardensis]|uniref:Uncharacterized protein n=1 Tax=Legionella beliardensis TaxID=91822 RepID=A0A378I3G7_9GAMM|nr:hypothetical protein [Legionella beliardensis]STX29543.1 Uncharacterised protein [Legionella beliardensis]